MKNIDKTDLENDFRKNTTIDDNPFPVEVFPKIIQEIIFEANDKLQFSIDYLGAGILGVISSAVGNSHKLKVKETWIEQGNLFIAIVGKTGDSKSPSLDFCFKPIEKKDDFLFNEYTQQLKDYETDNSENKSLKKPVLKKYLISDFTPEALILNLSNNPKGLYIYVDELNGWVKNFNRYNNSGEVEVYLTLWSGKTISTDRASGKNIRVKNPFLGVFGGVQPLVLYSFAKDGKDSNGFLDRLLFVFPENIKPIKWNKNKIDSRILENYNNLISNIILKCQNILEPQILELENEAKEYLFDWQNRRPSDFLFGYERSIEVKLQQYTIRFALLLQIINCIAEDKPIEKVELSAIKGAIKLFHYFLKNALKVREEIIIKTYYDSLSELQKEILNDLPKGFSTSDGVKIACKEINGKPRISERQFKNYLKDKRLFLKIEHGKYQKKPM